MIEAPSEFMTLDLADHILTITLNSPATRNALRSTSLLEIASILDSAADDDDVHVVLLTGAGPTFSSGGDLHEFIAGKPSIFEMATSRGAKRWVHSVVSFDKPIVTAVNGDCIGGATTLTLLSDIVVMSSEARIGDPHLTLGVVASGASCIWPALVGLLRAKEHILLGDLLPAAEAFRIGLVNSIVPPDEVLPRAKQIASRLAAAPQEGLRMQMRVFNRIVEGQFNSTHDNALAWEALSATTEGHRAALDAAVTRLKARLNVSSDSFGERS